MLQAVLGDEMGQVSSELRGLSEYVRSMRVEATGRVFARRERRFATEVAKRFAVIAMPSDGDCMFWSLQVGQHAHQASSASTHAAGVKAVRSVPTPAPPHPND